MIPHAKDDATITGDPEQLLFEAMPGRRDKESSDIFDALEFIEVAGLFEWWDREGNVIYFPPDSFYRYQTYIKADKRRAPLTDAEKRRETPNNAASLSPSPSLSPSLSMGDEPKPLMSGFPDCMTSDKWGMDGGPHKSSFAHVMAAVERKHKRPVSQADVGLLGSAAKSRCPDGCNHKASADCALDLITKVEFAHTIKKAAEFYRHDFEEAS